MLKLFVLAVVASVCFAVPDTWEANPEDSTLLVEAQSDASEDVSDGTNRHWPRPCWSCRRCPRWTSYRCKHPRRRRCCLIPWGKCKFRGVCIWRVTAGDKSEESEPLENDLAADHAVEEAQQDVGGITGGLNRIRPCFSCRHCPRGRSYSCRFPRRKCCASWHLYGGCGFGICLWSATSEEKSEEPEPLENDVATKADDDEIVGSSLDAQSEAVEEDGSDAFHSRCRRCKRCYRYVYRRCWPRLRKRRCCVVGYRCRSYRCRRRTDNDNEIEQEPPVPVLPENPSEETTSLDEERQSEAEEDITDGRKRFRLCFSCRFCPRKYSFTCRRPRRRCCAIRLPWAKCRFRGVCFRRVTDNDNEIEQEPPASALPENFSEETTALDEVEGETVSETSLDRGYICRYKCRFCFGRKLVKCSGRYRLCCRFGWWCKRRRYCHRRGA